jgi:polysaccharide biosynthesis transport protein
LADLRRQSEDLQSDVTTLKESGVVVETDFQGDPVLHSKTMDVLQRSAIQLSRARMNSFLKTVILEVTKTREAQLLSQLSGSPILSESSLAVSGSLADIRQLIQQQTLLLDQIDEDSSFSEHGSPKLNRELASLKTLQQSLQDECERAEQGAQADLESAVKVEDDSRAVYEGNRAAAKQLKDEHIGFDVLSLEFEQSRLLYLGLLNRLQQAGMLDVLHSSNVTVVEKASATSIPNNARTSFSLPLGAGWGVFFFCCTALLVDAVDTRRKTGPPESRGRAGPVSAGVVSNRIPTLFEARVWGRNPEETLKNSGTQQHHNRREVLAVGLPGSGKTLWFRREGISPLSEDMLRDPISENLEPERTAPPAACP